MNGHGVLDWPLEEDNPAVRYYVLRDIIKCHEYDVTLRAAWKMGSGRFANRTHACEYRARKQTKQMGHHDRPEDSGTHMAPNITTCVGCAVCGYR